MSFRKMVLSRLLKKPSPERYSISVPEHEQRAYNFFSVLGSTVEHDEIYVNGWDKTTDVVKYMWWSKGSPGIKGTDATCTFNGLKWETLTVRHTYRTWDIRYSNITEAFWHDILKISWCKWHIQKIRNLFLSQVNPDYRIQLLKKIVDKHNRLAEMTTHDLLIDKHGSAIRLSSEYYRHHTNLEFILSSLIQSGDLEPRKDNKIVPTPKSISTIAEFNEQITRHRDTVKLARGQFWLGCAMFVIAAVTLFVEIRK